jgi:hypothetical protein
MVASLYVETEIHAPMDRLWLLTQDPALHRRWDLRFTEIEPLQPELGVPGRFRYATRVLPFLTVAGTGVHAGERRRVDGDCTSALRFASDHPFSLIRDGSGYWRYLPGATDAIGFVTGYDYRPRWGRAGRLLDAVLFRPLMGWATAWSFDRLRIWLECDVPPEAARNLAMIEFGIRLLAVFAATALHPMLGFAVVVTAVLAPPLPTTPAARRCRRSPSRSVRPPRIAAALTPQETR